eukprot:m.181542 g.181542  ORF g.181542 m.181542 type:complete len:315 (-) comp18040_c0_seq3:117-1061(-)
MELSAAARKLIEEALRAHGGGEGPDSTEAPGGGATSDDTTQTKESSPDGAAAADATAADATAADGDQGQQREASTTGKKPKRNRNIEFPLRDINQFIVCKLCAGYLINAATVAECLHTFCRSCIVKHLRKSRQCPECDTMFHETNRFDMLRPDRTIQSIVYKVVPGLAEAERQREEEFLDSRGLKKRAQPKAEEPPPKKKGKQANTKVTPSADDQISFVLEKEKEGDAEDQVADERVTSLEKPYIRTSSKATILHLKKFLAKKLSLPRPEDVDILCRGEMCGKELSLEFISKTRWRNDEQLVLTYRPRVDFQQA